MPKETKLVTIYIDDVPYQVPEGANLVDVSKFYANNDIPVFCYHPKMSPVGMCRMCLVEMGTQETDRETRAPLFDDDGKPKVRWFPKLQTACTQTVTNGLAIRTQTPQVLDARDDIIEFLLTSHPLDCPICDKGGECPLQNLTIRHGEGYSRFNFEDKMDLPKHVPLGELIVLDRERCIQCARCTRFCDELVGDPVLGFHERGRKLQIVTLSDPPFDTYWSGNTTDVCPVGALTTTDFRFGARPWELQEIPSLDPYGPEGANTSLSTRQDREAGGMTIVKRVMPRQNEWVNEIWISDKTRFGHHHSRSEHRLINPLIRRNGELVDATWDEAYAVVAEAIKAAGANVGAVAGAMLSNEDLWELRQLVEHTGSNKLGVFPATSTGAEIVAQVGVGRGTNFKDMGKETTIMIVASDLEEEAPIWYLRAKQARDRGARLITVNARATKIDRYAHHRLSYDYGDAVAALNDLGGKSAKREGYQAAVDLLGETENLVMIVGNEGLSLEQHAEVMQSAANLLISNGHVGRPNNGLIPVWAGANVQGAFDLGYRAEATADALGQQVVIVAGADPMGTDLNAALQLQNAGFVVSISMFHTATTARADVVLPRQSVPERDGTFTSGERRVQRFYPAQHYLGATLPDWKMFAELHRRLDKGYNVKVSAGAVMSEITKNVPLYAEMSYPNLAKIERQFPDVGGDDLYYGGTAYENRGGMGVQWATTSENGGAAPEVQKVKPTASPKRKKGQLLAVPVRTLYDRSPEFLASELMHQRIPQPFAAFNPADAATLNLQAGEQISLSFGDHRVNVQARISDSVPEGVVLVPQNLAEEPIPLAPTVVGVEVLAHV